jgi:phosphoribosylformylglycinamidine cyclo-ligase
MADEKITGEDIREDNVLIGLPSNGLHTNGYSLVRKIIKEKKLSLDKYIPEFGHTLGEELLKVHRSYLDLLSPFPPFSSSSLPSINGIAHITGGGFYGNIPRIIPRGYEIVIMRNSWEVPYIFKFIRDMGNVPEDEMYRVFNMGIGMVLFVDRNKVDIALNTLGEGSIIGKVTKGKGIVFTF